MPDCLTWGNTQSQLCTKNEDQGYNQCTENKDEGYNQCTQNKDEGYDSCDSWGWLSFLCDGWTWISNIVCVAWTWISNVVCVAWQWISNVVCVAWIWMTTAVCLVWDFITTIINAVITVIESIVVWFLDAIAFVIELVFLIPYVGRFLQQLWNGVLFAFYTIMSLPDMALGAIGIRPEKILRLGVVYFTVDGTPIGNVDDIIVSIQQAIDVLRDQSNVRVIPVKPFQFSSGFRGNSTADSSWIRFVDAPSKPDVLDVSCNADGWAEDFTTIGSYFERVATTNFAFGDFRALIGYGAPVIAFVVRDVKNKSGCSLGPLTDYVTVKASMSLTLKHEIGHACSLFHCCDSANMMNGDTYPQGTNLDWWQTVLLRASKHATYF